MRAGMNNARPFPSRVWWRKV